MSRTARSGGSLALALVCAGAVGLGLQDLAPVGYISKDRVVEMATAADGSVADFTPSPDALASFVALVDPVHIRMFLCASRPADLEIAASVGQAAEAAANPALSVEFIAVTEGLSEPAAIVAENGVTEAPEIIIYWLGAEIGRMHPAAGDTVDEDLAALILLARTQIAEEMILDNDFFREVFHSDLTALDCKRCHGPR
jgi:hypothetical protein